MWKYCEVQYLAKTYLWEDKYYINFFNIDDTDLVEFLYIPIIFIKVIYIYVLILEDFTFLISVMKNFKYFCW